MPQFLQNITKFAGGVAAVALATTVFPMSAGAVVTVFTTQASFLAGTSSTQVVTFDNYSPGSRVPSPQVFTEGGGFSISASTSTLFPAGTASDVFMSTYISTDIMTIGSFTSGNISAIGGNFFGNDAVGLFQLGDVTVTATDASGTVSQTINGATLTSFLGFTSDGPLSSISIATVRPAGGDLWPAVNNLYVGNAIASATATAVPEPFTILGTILGAGYGVAVKRKLAKSQQD